MKRKNAGLSTVEIVVAAVILVAVVVGLLIVVKFSKNNDAPSQDEEQATQIVDALLSQVDTYIQSADLDVNNDADNYIRFVGKNKCQIYLFDSTASQVFFVEIDSSSLGTDDDAIRKAAATHKPAKEEMNIVARNVKTFVIDLIDADTEKGFVRTTVRAQVGKDIAGNVSKTKETPLNSAVISYFAERAGKSVDLPSVTPTPVPINTLTPTPIPNTPTPEPTKPGDTPTPEPTPHEKELKTKENIVTGTTGTRSVILNQYVSYKNKDAVLRIVVRRNENETENKKGASIGGICFGEVSTPDDNYLFILDHDPEVNEEFSLPTISLSEIMDVAQAAGIKKIMVKVAEGSGYDLVSINIDYWE